MKYQSNPSTNNSEMLVRISLPNSLQPDAASTLDAQLMQERLQIVGERRRQAYLSFNLAFVTTAACAVVTLTGAGLLLSNKSAQGVVASVSGLVSSFLGIHCLKLAKDANDRLDHILIELKGSPYH